MTNKGGRPRIEITAAMLRQISALAGYGLTEAGIARVIGVDPRTFRRRKRDEALVMSALENGKAIARATIGKALYEKAVAGDLGAIVWWEKTRAGLTDRVDIEHKGQVGLYRVLDGLGPDEAARLAALPDNRLREELRLLSSGDDG